ncbi:PSP1 domain-containing protein [Hydrogenobaculum acidophilum]
MKYTYIRYMDTNKIGLLEGINELLQKDTFVIISKDDYVDIAKVVGYSDKLYDVKPSFFIRKATKQDISRMYHLKKVSQHYMKIAKELSKQHNLSLKFIKAYVPIDDVKSFFFYTAESRVDFRQLVKDLAKAIKKRIEMRQIGTRDAVQILGAVGMCGFKTCCSNFIDTFESVNLKDMEMQNLPMSPSKFTGPCGKLVCCMSFEKINYVIKYILPPTGTAIGFNHKEYTISHIDPIKNVVSLSSEEDKLNINVTDLLPEGYEIAVKKCASCGGCCASNTDHQGVLFEEVFV